MDFINDRFMIDSEVGVRLYKDIAAQLPIIDYHCHLDAKEIYENNYTVFFEHDPYVEAGKIGFDNKSYFLKEKLNV